MSGTSYNGYDWKQREAILKAYRQGAAGPGFTFVGKPCGLCGDPERPGSEWHSEDYSEPFLFEPPATYPVCKACHGRLHKRFNRPASEWEFFCRHLEAGGYGREFTSNFTAAQRAAMTAALERGEPVELARVRDPATTSAWWRELTLDPESLHAAWSRPRPFRPRPDASAYEAAIATANPTNRELAILQFHAAAPRRTATMRQVASAVLGSDRPSDANLAYGKLAKRIGEHVAWQPDVRVDGTPFWMSVVAEGWQPPDPREYELTMIPVLAAIFGQTEGRR